MKKEAFLSLVRDFDRAVFYWIVLTLSAMFIYTFFHVALSDIIGVTYFYGKNDLQTYLTTFDVFVCIIVIFMANDFYVKKKSRELAVMLMCGGTYTQTACFLMFQTGILIVTSLAAGIGLGKLCVSIIGRILGKMAGSVSFDGGSEAVLMTTAVIVLEVFWCILVNLGYAYRNSIYTLLQGEEKIKVRVPHRSKNPKVQKLYPYVSYSFVALYAGCGGLMYFLGHKPEWIRILGALGMIGLWGGISRVLLPWLEKGVLEKWGDDGEKFVYMGLFREDLKTARLYICLFISSAGVLCSMAAGTIRQRGEIVMCLMSFSMVIPLLALSLMFRFVTETWGRKKQFEILLKIGYEAGQIQRIQKNELVCLYGFIMAASLYYILNIVIVLSINRLLPAAAGALMAGIFIVSLGVCGAVNYQYSKTMTFTTK